MKKIKKIFKYLSYTLLYLIVSIATAYGVITISINNANNFNDGSAESKVPEQITNIINGITNSTALDFDLEIAIKSPSENFTISIKDTQIDLSSGFENLAFSSTINVFMENANQNIPVSLSYKNGNLYVEALNNQFKVETNNIISSVTEVLNLINVEMPDLSSFASLDFNGILGMLSNFKETKTKENITLDIQIPVIGGTATLVCDKSYKLQQIIVPSLEIEGMEIIVNGNVGYPESVEIKDVIDEDYINVTTLLDIAKKLISYLKSPIITMDIDLSYNDMNLNGALSLDLTNFNFKVSAEILDYQLNILSIENNIYLEFANIYAKFDINNLGKLDDILNRFNVDIPTDTIINIINTLKESGISALIDALGGNNNQNNENTSFDINSIDLSILESIVFNDNTTTITIKDLCVIEITSEDDQLSSISFEGFGLSTKLKVLSSQEIVLASEETNYVDLAKFIPTALNVLDLVDCKVFTGKVEVKYNDLVVPVNYKVSIENGLYAEASIDLGNEVINVYFNENILYLSCGNIKIKADVNNIQNVVNKVIELFSIKLNIEVSPEDKEKLTNTIKDVFDKEKNQLLIKELVGDDTTLSIKLFNDLVVSIVNGEKELTLSTSIQGIDLSIKVVGGDTLTKVTPNENEYSDVEDIVSLVEKVYNYVKDRNVFAFDINASYSGITVVGKLALDIQNKTIKLVANINGYDVNLIFTNKTIYLDYKNIYVKFNINNLNDVQSILNKFNVNFDLSKVVTIVNNVCDNGISAVKNLLPKNDTKLDVSDIDLSKFDLSILESLTLNDSQLSVKLKDLCEINLVANTSLDYVEFNGFGANAKLNVTNVFDFNLSTEETNYVDLAKLIPTISNVLDLVDCKVFTGKVEVKYNDLIIPIDYKVSIEDGLYAEASIEIGNEVINVYFNENTLYLSCGNIKIKAGVNNIQNVIDRVVELFNINLNLEISAEDKEKLTNTIEDVFNKDINPLLIKELVGDDTTLTIKLFNDLVVSIVNSEKEITLLTTIQGLNLSIQVASSDTLTKVTPNGDEYSDVEDIVTLVEKVYNYVKDRNVFAFDINASYSGITVTGKLALDIQNKTLKLVANINGYDVNLVFTNKTIYLDYQNIYVKFNINDLNDVQSILNKFNVNFDLAKVVTIVNDVYDNGIDAIKNLIPKNDTKFDPSTIDLSKFDLSILEKFILNDCLLSIKLKDLCEINIVTNTSLDYIEFNGFDAYAKLNVTNEFDFNLSTEETNYVDLAKLIPTISNVLDLVDCKVFTGKVEVKYNDLIIPIDYKVSIEDGLYAEASIEIGNEVINVYFNENTLYLSCGNIKVKADVNNIQNVIDRVVKLFNINLNIEISSEDKEKLTNTIKDIFDKNINPLLIKELVDDDTTLTIKLFNDLVVSIVNGEKEITLSTSIQGLNLSIQVVGGDKLTKVTPNGDEYSDVEDIVSLVEKVYSYVKDRNVFAFDINASYSGITVVGKLALDIQNKTLKLVANINGYDVNLIFTDKTIYLDYQNIYVKFNINQLGDVQSILNKFNVNFDLSKVVAIVNDVYDNGFKAITNLLPKNDAKFDVSSIDLSKFDLSILESLTLNDSQLSVKLRDLCEINLVANTSLDYVEFNGFGANAKLDVTNEFDFNLSSEETNYVDLAKLIPTALNVLDLVDCKVFTGKVEVKYNDLIIPVDYKVSIEDGLYAEASIELFGHKLDIVYSENIVYVELSNTKLKVNIENIDTIYNSIIKDYGIKIENNSSNFTSILTSILDRKNNPLLIKELVSNENTLSIKLFNDVLINILSGENSIEISTSYKGIDLGVNVNASNDTITKRSLLESEYTDIENLLPIAKNIYNYVLGNKYFVEFNGRYNDITLSGAINYQPKDISFTINVNFKGLNGTVMLYQNEFYISAENLKFKFGIDDIETLKLFLKNEFKLDLDKLINDLATKSGVDINNIIDFVLGKTDKFEMPSIKSSTSFNIEKVESIVTALSFNINDKYIEVAYNNDLNATIKFTSQMFENVKVNYNDIEGFAQIQNKPFEFEPMGEYLNVTELISYAEKLLNYVKTKQIDLDAIITTTKENNQSVMNGKIQVDLTETLKLSALFNADNNDIAVNIEDGMLYFDYNGLLIKINNDNFNELLYIILEVFGIDTSRIPFLKDLDLDLDFSQVSATAPSMKIEDIIKIAKMIKSFNKVGNNLILTIDGYSVYNNNETGDIILTLATNGSEVTKIMVNNIHTSSTSEEKIDVEISFNDWETFNNVDKTKNYIDISGSNELIKAFINMSTGTDFNVTGSLNILGNLIGIDIKWNIPYEINIKATGKGKIELYGWMGEIPAVIGVNNDVPYEFGDTESGSGRMLYFYYREGYVYIYRSEYIDIMFGAGKRHYEKCVKVALSNFLGDPMFYVQYATGFTDSIMSAIEKAMSKSANRTTPMDYGNIIKSFIVLDNTNFTINLNMAEITNNPDLDSVALTLALSKDVNNKNYVSDLSFSMYMPLADAFKLTVSTNDTKINDYGKKVDMTPLDDYINNYQYGEGEFWQASKDKWTLASEVTYTLDFIENGGEEIANITQKPGTPLTLPSYENIIIDDGITKTTKKFAGWYTSENFKKGSEFTSTVMPSRDYVLYAKWVDNVEKYQTLTFITNCQTTFASITKLEGEYISLPTLTTKQETEGDITTNSRFTGWYTQEDCSEESLFSIEIMPNQSYTLYAGWEITSIEKTKTLNIYDNGSLIFTRRFKSGNVIDFSECDKVNDKTLFYIDEDCQVPYTGNFEMPDEDLNLYVRNQYTLTLTSDYGDTTNKVYNIYQNSIVELPSQEDYVVDDGVTRTTYHFVGYSEELTVMPRENKVLSAVWDIDVKHYYTITFALEYYPPNGGVKLGGGFIEEPTPIQPVRVLEGTELDLTQYISTCKIKLSAFGNSANYKSSSWGTSSWPKFTNGNSGFTSYMVTGDQTLYACWEKIQ